MPSFPTLKVLQGVIYEAECASKEVAPQDSARLKNLELRIATLYRNVCDTLPERFHKEEFVVSASERLPLFQGRVADLTNEAISLLVEMKTRRWFILIQAQRFSDTAWRCDEEAEELEQNPTSILDPLAAAGRRLEAAILRSTADSIRSAYFCGQHIATHA